MPSLIAWLDYSEDQRRRMREVIDLFRESDTLDELGIGQVRDAFGDLLFPGLSTTQTRARYLLFVPWLYLRVEAERVPSHEAERRVRQLHTRLIDALRRGGADAGDGVIGWDARERLQRLPSSVYWGGLGAFGIRRFSGSVADYHRSLDGFYRRLAQHSTGEGDEVVERLPPNWHPSLPPPPPRLWEETTMDLDPREAEFLRDQFALAQPRSLLAHLALHPDPAVAEARFPWDLPSLDNLDDPTRTWLLHARCFSLVMHGAALAYNLLLARLAIRRGLGDRYGHWVTEYEAALGRWAEEVMVHDHLVSSWRRDELWDVVRAANPRISRLTVNFIDTWVRWTQDDPLRVAGLPDEVQGLIEQRETQLKRSQARLRNHRALELWGGASGTRRLDYRWGTAQRILLDLYRASPHA